MGKVELKLEVDADLLSRLDAAGIDPLEAANAGLHAADKARSLSLVENGREKARDPEGARRRARAWAEASATSIAEHNAWVAEHGCFGEAWRGW